MFQSASVSAAAEVTFGWSTKKKKTKKKKSEICYAINTIKTNITAERDKKH